MAKSKSFFGLRRGSTKSLTFSVLNGQQVTKDRVYGGKNPRSLAQMIQRMCMATSSAAYAAMKQIVDHSFEGVSYGANTMAKFLSVNTKALKENYQNAGDDFGYNPYGDRGLKLGEYVMSQGTASDIRNNGLTPQHTAHGVGMKIAVAGTGGNTATNLFATLGIAVGDLCTFCFMYALDGSAEDWKFGFIRLTALQAGDTVLTSENISTYVKIESNLGNVPLSIVDNNITMIITVMDDDTAITDLPYCAIHSVKSNGAWLRSNSTLNVPGTAEIAPSAADALATYPVGESYVLNGGEIE